ncbi:MAG: hypothetical protein ACRCXL_05840 [Dermatophilaceae bacterium]
MSGAPALVTALAEGDAVSATSASSVHPASATAPAMAPAAPRVLRLLMQAHGVDASWCCSDITVPFVAE